MLKDRSFKFSGNEIAVLSLVFCVSLLLAFWLGYRTGHTVGFDYAQNVNLNNVARYPINDYAAPELDSESVEQIYARLSDDAVTEAATEEHKNEVPALAPIAETQADISKIKTETKAVETKAPESTEIQKAVKNEPAVSNSESVIANLDALPRERMPEPAAMPMVIEEKKTKVEDRSQIQVAAAEVAEQAEEKAAAKIENVAVAPKAPPAEVVAIKKTEAEENKLAKNIELKKEPAIKNEIAPQVTEVTPPIKKKMTSGWYAQVFAPQDKMVADKLASTLRQSGFPVTVEPAAGHYRVLVGPESNKQQGQVLLQQLSREKYLPGSPFLKQIK
jgi:cell division septation protein DedD